MNIEDIICSQHLILKQARYHLTAQHVHADDRAVKYWDFISVNTIKVSGGFSVLQSSSTLLVLIIIRGQKQNENLRNVGCGDPSSAAAGEAGGQVGDAVGAAHRADGGGEAAALTVALSFWFPARLQGPKQRETAVSYICKTKEPFIRYYGHCFTFNISMETMQLS